MVEAVKSRVIAMPVLHLHMSVWEGSFSNIEGGVKRRRVRQLAQAYFPLSHAEEQASPARESFGLLGLADRPSTWSVLPPLETVDCRMVHVDALGAPLKLFTSCRQPIVPKAPSLNFAVVPHNGPQKLQEFHHQPCNVAVWYMFGSIKIPAKGFIGFKKRTKTTSCATWMSKEDQSGSSNLLKIMFTTRELQWT
jgi:hypothetical protein